MAEYNITAPDGTKFKITAPDDATPEQVHAYAMEHAPKMGFGESFGNQLKQYAVGTQQALGKEIPPEEISKLKYESARQGTGGQMAADALVGVPLQIGAGLTPWTGGPFTSGAISGGIQAGMMPVGEGESRTRNVAAGAATGGALGKGMKYVAKAVAPVVEPATNAIQRAAQRVTGAVTSNISPEVRDVVNTATEKFGFKLLPGQKTDVTALRARETGYRANAASQDSMTAVQRHNEDVFNRTLADEMGVPNAKKITPQVLDQARRQASAQEVRALGGKTLAIDPMNNGQFQADIAAAMQGINQPATTLFGNKASSILTKAGQLHTIDGMDYKWLRSDLQARARTYFNSTVPADRENGKAIKAVVDALDKAVDTNAQMPGSRFTVDDLNLVKDARRKWKGILTVEDSRRQNFAVDPNKWATNADKWYSPGERMHELIQVIDNVPDIKQSIGVPKKVAPAAGAPFATVSTTGVRVGEGIGSKVSGAMQPFYMSAAQTPYYDPAQVRRQLMAQILALGGKNAGQSEQLDYVTR